MKKSLFKITSLNFNGIRSAATKGMEAWVEKSALDCMCVQEIKAQVCDMAGKFEHIAGMQGYFHCAEKKGYSGVGVYSRHVPSDVIMGFDGGEFDSEGRYVELRFDTLERKFSVISSYFPSGSAGPHRQEAKFRFLDKMYPHSWAGLAECFTMALPFFRNSLLGDLAYTAAAFTLFGLALRRLRVVHG